MIWEGVIGCLVSTLYFFETYETKCADHQKFVISLMPCGSRDNPLRVGNTHSANSKDRRALQVLVGVVVLLYASKNNFCVYLDRE